MWVLETPVFKSLRATWSEKSCVQLLLFGDSILLHPRQSVLRSLNERLTLLDLNRCLPMLHLGAYCRHRLIGVRVTVPRCHLRWTFGHCAATKKKMTATAALALWDMACASLDTIHERHDHPERRITRRLTKKQNSLQRNCLQNLSVAFPSWPDLCSGHRSPTSRDRSLFSPPLPCATHL